MLTFCDASDIINKLSLMRQTKFEEIRVEICILSYGIRQSFEKMLLTNKRTYDNMNELRFESNTASKDVKMKNKKDA